VVVVRILGLLIRRLNNAVKRSGKNILDITLSTKSRKLGEIS
jgi:hypothetical protein